MNFLLLMRSSIAFNVTLLVWNQMKFVEFLQYYNESVMSLFNLIACDLFNVFPTKRR